MNTLVIDNIKSEHPGITPAEGTVLVENAVVAMHKALHKSPLSMTLTGMTTQACNIEWNTDVSEQMLRTHADEEVNTERAAVCFSVLLTKELTGLTILQRSCKGNGFDYWLTDSVTSYFPKAILEVSGIASETQGNTLLKRVEVKKQQIEKSKDLGLPGYISIIEFSTPKAYYNRVF